MPLTASLPWVFLQQGVAEGSFTDLLDVTGSRELNLFPMSGLKLLLPCPNYCLSDFDDKFFV